MILSGWETVFFWIFAIAAIIAGLFTVMARNAVHSALFLISSLVSVGALFILLGAEFIAGVQILVYVGGVMVLFLFVIMLVSIERTVKERQFNKQWLVGIIAAGTLGGLFITVYTKGKDIFPDRALPAVEAQNTQNVGNLLYSQYMFAFEIASLLLLVAIIGAVVMAKKRI